MPKVTAAEWFLSLFTTPDRASAIVGDLSEQGRASSFDVLRTAGALFIQSTTAQPLRLLFLVVLGFALERITIFSAQITYSWLPATYYASKACQVWAGVVAPALIGYVVARLAQGREVAACLAFVLTHAFLQLAFVRYALVHGWSGYRICTILFFTDAVPALAILAAATITRRLVLSRNLRHAH